MSLPIINQTIWIFNFIYRPPGYERVYLTLCKVADTPFHIQGDDILQNWEFPFNVRWELHL